MGLSLLLAGSSQPVILLHQSHRSTTAPLSRRLLSPRCLKGRRRIPRASQNSGESEEGPRFGWDSVRIGSERFFSIFGDRLKEETGIDVESATAKAWGEVSCKAVDVFDRVRRAGETFDLFWTALFPRFLDWNKWERWKNPKEWEAKRIAVLILYGFIAVASVWRMYTFVITPRLNVRSKRELREAYMESVIPEPSPSNIRKVKKSIWRKTMPKGLKIKKFTEAPDGTIIHDDSYVGEAAWEDEPEPSQNVSSLIDKDPTLDAAQKEELKRNLGIASNATTSGMPWRERLAIWKEILRRDKITEELDSLNAKYVVDFDMEEVEKSLCKDIVEKVPESHGSWPLWISKRWWLYRPKLPYMYFLDKLDCSEVAVVVFSDDLKKLYVTMKEGFPLEYIVDIPLDPCLFETISSSGVEIDLLQRTQLHYLFKVVMALAPAMFILFLIKEAVTLFRITSNRVLFKRYNQFMDLAYQSDNFTMSLVAGDGIKSMSKEVVLGGDVWDIVHELMMYLSNPMRYYEKEVPFVRGILLSGPPGTGKTLFARTLAKESGLPFVFASGAEFSESENGVARIHQLFSLARRNAPSFMFVDEIDAIAGKQAKSDPRRRGTLQTLLNQLDGEKDRIGIDRYSLQQAIIFICATNRPDELDPDLIRLGRIDRRVHIGLPNAKQRVKIFAVHSVNKKFADDVNFEKLVFRTVGYSGADIRSLVNEAAIMSVRNGHPLITQQDIIDVLDKQLLEGMGVLLTEEEQQKCAESVSFETKRLLAVHEAGHILLAHLFPCFDWHAFSQLLPGGKETSISVFSPREDLVGQKHYNFGYMKMQMVVAHGGRCAEHVTFGDDISDGGREDLERISRIAREMVINPNNSRLGFANLTQGVGKITQSDGSDGEIIKYRWEDPYVLPVDMPVEVSELFTRELTRYIEETEEIAMNGLKQNKHIFDMIVDVLLEKNRITGLEMKEKMKAMSPVMFEDFTEPYQINIDEESPLPKRDRLSYQPLDVFPAPLHRG